MVGHETVMVQDNQTNLLQGAENERLEREEEKLKNEENEVKEMNPVKQQVVQNGGNDQTAGVGTKTDAPVNAQTIQAQNVTFQGLEDLSGSLFSVKGFEEAAGCKIKDLPSDVSELGKLLEKYSHLINSPKAITGQNREAMIETLDEIQRLVKKYLKNPKVSKSGVKKVGNRRFNKKNGYVNIKKLKIKKDLNTTLGAMQFECRQKIKRLKAGESVIPPKRTILPTSGPLPMPGMKPVAQQMQQQTKIAKPVGEEVKQEETKPVVDEVKQEEKTQNDIQQLNKEKEPEITGPSMRKDFLDVMRKSADGAGNEYYKKLIGKFEELYQLLGEPIKKDNQEKSWKNLQKAYGELAEWSEGYAKAYMNAPTAIGRVRRRQARMLMLMCSFDMRTLRIANSDPKLAEKNTTWRQILEQPTGALAAQQNQSQQTEAKDAAQTNQPKVNPARDFRDYWKSRLEASKKGGLRRKNSEYFNSVQDALEQTAKAMEQGFGRDSRDNMKKLSEAAGALQALLAACQAYNARNPRTKNGKNRRDIVLQIQKYAAQDLIGCQKAISDFIGLEPEEQARQTWMSVLQKARSVQVTVEDLSKLTPEKKGQASEVFKIESQEGNHTVTKYFKKEDSLDMDAVKMKGKRAGYEFALQQTLEQYPNLSAKDKKSLQKLNENSGNSDLSKKDFSDEGIVAGKYLLNRMGRLNDTVISGLMKELGIVDEGGMANMTRRNVATSRIAKLLGLEHLVANSETVEIYDKATGRTIRGNLMDQAKGVENESVRDKLKNNQITSGFMRDLMNLQVLDTLCGQVDRNVGNMLYSINGEGEEAKVSGIQGIDNDAAFGTNTDVMSATDGVRSDARVVDAESGEMVVPYMDDELAQRILDLKSEVVEYVLKDLLKEDEIQSFILRLDTMQKGITKARKDHPDRFLKGDDAWILMEEGKPSVERELLIDYNNAVIQMDPDTWRKKELVLSTASEIYKDDPKTLEAIRLFYEDKEAFEKDYDKDERKMLEDEINKVIQKTKARQQYKYGARVNYFGRIKNSWSNFRKTETVV